MVERAPYKCEVGGSIPSGPITRNFLMKGTRMKKSPEFTMELNEGDIDFRTTFLMQMKAKKVTIAKLARAADLNYQTVFNFLKGKTQMRSGNLCKIFNTLNKMKAGD